MKEIDFLPEWYKQERKQQEKHREFYVAIGLIVFIMIAWGIFANGRVTAAKARNAYLQNARITRINNENGYNRIESEYQQLKAKGQLIKSIKSHIVVSNVIAEITHLLDRGVILKKLNIKAEEFAGQDKKPTELQNADKTTEFDKKKKYKITITGLAVDSKQVAEVINKLEQSKYFFQIVPNFTKNTTVGQYQASEFEIVCWLANYKLMN